MSEPGLTAGNDRNDDEQPRARKPQQRRQQADTSRARDTRTAAEREANDREVLDDREISEAERLEFFRDSLQQSVLPDLPKMDGYHVCWLSTSNPRDTIAYRRRIGYQLIRSEDMPGWDGETVKAGDLQGVVCINEMVAAKIPLSLFNKYMRHVHHELPLGEESKLKVRTDMLKQQAEKMGSKVIEGEGMATLGQGAEPMEELVD